MSLGSSLEGISNKGTSVESHGLSAGDLHLFTRANFSTDNAVKEVAANPAAAGSDLSKLASVLDGSAMSKLQQWIQENRNLQFTTDSQSADYLLKPDGSLEKNPNKQGSSPDGQISIAVQPKDGSQQSEYQAKKLASDLQKASINEQINYRRKWDPNARVDDLLSKLATVPEVPTPSEAPSVDWPQGQKPDAPQASQPPGVDAPSSPGGSPRGGPTGGSPGGNMDVPSFSPRDVDNGAIDPSDSSPITPAERMNIPKIAGDMNVINPNPEITAKDVQDYLVARGSPAANEQGFAQGLIDACKRYDVDPRLALGFFECESNCGTARRGSATERMSIGNIKPGGRTGEGDTWGGRVVNGFRAYDSWIQGAQDWARLIGDVYVRQKGLTMASEVIGTYAPRSDGNNTTAYLATVKGVSAKLDEIHSKNSATV